MLVSATSLNMPSLLLILMVGLLLPQGMSCAGKGKPFNELAINTQVMYVQRKLEFIGCYSATFHITKLVDANGRDCKVVCKPFEQAWPRKLYRLRRTENICLVGRVAYKLEHGASNLGHVEPADTCSPEMCSCQMRVHVKDILLSPSERSRRSNQGIPQGQVKSGTSGPSPSVELKSFGSTMTPSNCNASTFAPWLALKLELKSSDATFSDVKFDPKCEAFIEFAGPLEPRGDIEAEYEALRKRAAQERMASRERKSKTANPQLHHKMPKRQRTKGGSCSAPRYSLPDLNLPAPESLTEPFDDGRQDPNPAGAVSAATHMREQLEKQMNEDAAMWVEHFPGAIAIAQQDDDGDQ